MVSIFLCSFLFIKHFRDNVLFKLDLELFSFKYSQNWRTTISKESQKDLVQFVSTQKINSLKYCGLARNQASSQCSDKRFFNTHIHIYMNLFILSLTL